ncbi:MAG: TonB-dependent receptor [Sphingobacteriaceae bacterium]|nr:TonB-dependent receptor [Sphingobacteriaceae bacterium]
MFAMLAMLLPVVAVAQLSISGKIIDQITKQPLAGASIKAGNNSSVSNTLGEFSITDLEIKSHSIKVSYLGYRDFNTVVNLKTNENLQIALTPSGIVTDEVIVSATRANKNSATTYRNVSKEELEKNNLGQDLPYLLNQTPSVVVSSDAGAGVGYTGIRIRGSDATRINVTINGIPLNDAESQGSFFINLPDFASSVNNIQIQRGVGTSTNGAGAFGGSLNIQTLTQRDSAYADLNNSFGSFNTRKHTLNIGSGLISDKFTFDGRLSNIVSDGFIDRGSSKLKSYFLSAAYYGKSDLLRANVFGGDEKTYQVWNGIPQAKLTGNNEDLLAHYYNNLGYLYNTTEDSINLWDSDKRTYSQFLYDNQTDNYKQTHYQLLYNHTFSSRFSLNSALHYTRGKGYYEEFKNTQVFEEYGFNPVEFGATADQQTNLIRRRWLDNDFYGITYSLNFKPTTEANLIVGGAYNEYDGDHFGEIIAAPQLNIKGLNKHYYDGKGFKKDFNLYTKLDFEVGKARVFYDFQFRYLDYAITGTDKTLTNHDKRYYSKFYNPKIGVNYQVSQTSDFYTSFAIANKEPNRDDYLNAIAGFLPMAETLRNVEVGYRIKKSRFRAELNAYGMFYKNQLISTGKVNDVGEYIRQNVPESSRLGIELDAGLQLSNKLTWVATAALSRNRIDKFTEFMDDYDNGGQTTKTYDKTNIAFSPSTVLSSEIAYKLIKNAEIALLSKYVGEQFLDNTSNRSRMLDDYFVNDIRVSYNTSFGPAKNVGISLLVNNIFDKEYEANGYSYTYIYGVPITENFYFPQATRNFLASLSLKF